MGSDDRTAPVHASSSAGRFDADERLGKGTLIGRYVVLERLGSGGAGAVFAAYDTQLDRRVALKILHAGLGQEVFDAESDHWKHVVREARLLGRLNHPNVVTVFDVGVEDGIPFIAMELVEGTDLASWLGKVSSTDTDRREIVERFVQAARGLAAAHAQGIVHGDFKPANCLLGADGRVRVSDFGLARAHTEEASSEDGEASVDEPATQGESGTSGTLPRQVGTPYYMAPEQHLGERPRTQSDVYSFCLALTDAYLGKPLLQSTSLAGLAVEKLHDEHLPRLDAGLPRKLREVVRAGLQQDADARPQSMVEVCEALERILSPTTRRTWVAAGIAATAGAGVLTVAAWQEPPDPCDGIEARLEGIWDEPTRATMAQAFAEADADDARWAKVEAGLDAYARQWVQQRTDACRAHQSGASSGELLDRRNICLDRRFSGLRALLDLLADPDPELAARAPTAVAGLPSIDPCGDAEALLAEMPWPDDPALRTEIENAYVDVAQVEALTLAGKTHEALEQAQPLVERARAIAFEPLLADALMGLGGSYLHLSRAQEAYDTLREAHFTAIRGGYRQGTVETAADLSFLCLHLDRLDEGQQWEDTARAHLSRLGSVPWLQEKLEANRGRRLQAEGDYEGAATHLQRAVELRIAERGPDDEGLGSLYTALGDVAISRNDYEAALQHLELARASKLASLEPDHPSHAVTSMMLGIAHFEHGQYAQAQKEHRRALVEFERGLGAEHPAYGEILFNLGNALAEDHKLEEAKTVYQQALEVYRAGLGERSQEVGLALLALGKTELDLHAPEAALELIERAHDVLAEALGPDDPYTLDAVEAVGEAYLMQGKPTRALQRFETTLAAKRAADPPDPRSLAFSLVNAGRALIELGRIDPAAELFAEALQVRLEQSIDGRPLGDAYYWLAVARWRQGQEDEARSLMQQSQAVHLDIDDPPGVRRAEQWLRDPDAAPLSARDG